MTATVDMKDFCSWLNVKGDVTPRWNIEDEKKQAMKEVIARLTPTEDGFRDLSFGQEVVRCEKCAKSTEVGYQNQYRLCCWWGRFTPPDGFCHEGVRK